MNGEPETQTDTEPALPKPEDLSASEFREHRLGGKSLADIAKARTTEAPEAGEAPVVEKPADEPKPRDEAGKFTAKPKEGNPRHDPRARIDELTREKSDAIRRAEAAEAERERFRAELDAYRKGEGPKPEPVKVPPPAATDDFPEYGVWADLPENAGKTYDRYVREAAKYELAQERKAADEKAQQAEVQKKNGEVQTQFQGREVEFRKTTADYDDVIQRSPVAALPLPPWVLGGIVTSDQGPALRYYLAQHAEETTQLASMPPDAALRFLGRLEERLAAASTVTAPDSTPITQAPAPFKTVGSGPTANSRSLETVAKSTSNTDYRRLREAGVRS